MATKQKNKKTVTPKKAVKKVTTVKSSASLRKPVTSIQAKVINAPEKKVVDSPKIRKAYVVLAIVILGIALIAYKYRGLFVAASVNGQPISRIAVVKESEKQSGKQTLSNLVRNTLIEQEAKKQNVTVTDKEIDTEIKRVEGTLAKQGQKLDQVLALQGITKQDLRKLIRLDKIVGKLVGRDIKVSDKDIADYIEKNQESLPKDQSEEQIKASVKERLRQQQLNAKVQTWLESLQKNAKVQYFVQY